MCSTRESPPYAPGAARSLHHADKLASVGLYLELQTGVLHCFTQQTFAVVMTHARSSTITGL